jgi:hypothetical protein
MKDQLITFETAKLAKEKGFKELCFAAFHKNNNGDGYFESGIIDQSEYFKFPTMSNGDKIAVLQKDYIHTILRPTQSLLQKWLRETHNISIELSSNDLDGFYYEVVIIKENSSHLVLKNRKGNNMFENTISIDYSTYEEALELGLQEALKLIK